MSITDTATYQEDRRVKKKVIIYSCRDCPNYVWRKHENENWCYYKNMTLLTSDDIINLPIPNWCKLQDA